MLKREKKLLVWQVVMTLLVSVVFILSNHYFLSKGKATDEAILYAIGFTSLISALSIFASFPAINRGYYFMCAATLAASIAMFAIFTVWSLTYQNPITLILSAMVFIGLCEVPTVINELKISKTKGWFHIIAEIVFIWVIVAVRIFLL